VIRRCRGFRIESIVEGRRGDEDRSKSVEFEGAGKVHLIMHDSQLHSPEYDEAQTVRTLNQIDPPVSLSPGSFQAKNVSASVQRC
jgi:hypothetical protein